jgi:hypothetical protein
MKIFCCITMDVEVDKSSTYHISDPPGFKNVTEAIPRLLEPLFLKYRVKPTYLLSSEIIQDRECVETLKNLQSDHELGTHGHGELLDPDLDIHSLGGAKLHDFINDYSREEQYARLSWLTGIFVEKFGYSPRSFRGGRFGIDAKTLSILEELGYAVDSTVTPGTCWFNTRQVMNYLEAPEQPYQPSENALTEVGGMSIAEVPVSSWLPNRWGRRLLAYRARSTGVCTSSGKLWERLIYKTIGRLYWLRPTFGSPASLIRQAKNYLRRIEGKPAGCVNIMFHPIELVEGASPYALNRDQVQRILLNLEALINFFAKRRCTFAKLQDIPQLMNGAGSGLS